MEKSTIIISIIIVVCIAAGVTAYSITSPDNNILKSLESIGSDGGSGSGLGLNNSSLQNGTSTRGTGSGTGSSSGTGSGTGTGTGSGSGSGSGSDSGSSSGTGSGTSSGNYEITSDTGDGYITTYYDSNGNKLGYEYSSYDGSQHEGGGGAP